MFLCCFFFCFQLRSAAPFNETVKICRYRRENKQNSALFIHVIRFRGKFCKKGEHAFLTFPTPIQITREWWIDTTGLSGRPSVRPFHKKTPRPLLWVLNKILQGPTSGMIDTVNLFSCEWAAIRSTGWFVTNACIYMYECRYVCMYVRTCERVCMCVFCKTRKV